MVALSTANGQGAMLADNAVCTVDDINRMVGDADLSFHQAVHQHVKHS